MSSDLRRGFGLAVTVGAIVSVTACVPSTPSADPSAGSAVPSASASSSAPASPSGSGSSSSGTSSSGTSSSGTSSSGTPTTGILACTSAGLEVDIIKAGGGGAAGSNYLLVRFGNTTGKPCTLYGWPGVSLVGDGNGTQLGAAAKRVQGGDRHTVTIRPGKRTTALLRVSNAGNYSRSDCDPVDADGFRIYAPDAKDAVYVKRKTPACRKSGVALMDIAPVGTSG